MLGVLFTMPQYFQGVLGTTAMGSGLRLLPLVGGLMLGAVPAARVVRLVGAKVAVAAGFVLLAVGLFLGSTMVWVRAASSWRLDGGRRARDGHRHGHPMSAALVELSEEKSGVGSGVLQAVNKTGAPLGIAILGSVLSAGYLARLDLAGLPAAAAAAARQSVFGGVAVAQKLHSPALLTSVQTAFVHGMDLALLVSAGIALAGVVLTCLPAGVECRRRRRCSRTPQRRRGCRKVAWDYWPGCVSAPWRRPPTAIQGFCGQAKIVLPDQLSQKMTGASPRRSHGSDGVWQQPRRRAGRIRHQ